MARIRVKICGITRPEDAAAAAAAGADAVGLVFYPSSPRAVDIGAARVLSRALPPFVTRVGLFVDADPAEIEAVLNSHCLDMLQFHGSEAPADCERYDMPYMKAIKVMEGVDLHAQARRYNSASALLLDTHVAGLAGGTGKTFPWERVPGDLSVPVVLAGGLNEENVIEAVSRVRPYAVDVSGGVESSPGIKDSARIRAFIHKVGSYSHE
ncbi:MAG: phosphoribosylanthranilate isomerase [Gammaproteobacteria bacterium]